jgi:hypothetical protein
VLGLAGIDKARAAVSAGRASCLLGDVNELLRARRLHGGNEEMTPKAAHVDSPQAMQQSYE